MNELLARIISRDDGKKDSDDGLIVGSLTREGRKFIKKGYIYSLISILDTPTLVEEGPAHIPKKLWHNKVGDLLDDYEEHLFLTKKEWAQYLRKDG